MDVSDGTTEFTLVAIVNNSSGDGTIQFGSAANQWTRWNGTRIA